MKLTWHRVVYPLRFPFKLSYGTYTERMSYLVRIESQGDAGWGEMSFVPYYKKEESDIQQQLASIQALIQDVDDDWTPASLYKLVAEQAGIDPFVASAVDCALYDLYGRRQDVPVWQLTGGSQKVKALSSLTITQDDWQEKLQWNWPSLKLKMGFEGDMELLAAIRLQFDGILRIDVNSGWSYSQWMERKQDLVAMAIELVEQPLSLAEDGVLDQNDFVLPLVADESFQGLKDMDTLANKYAVVNIKLQKCGGITPALQILQQAKAMGLKVMAGCMTESSIGIGAMCHLGGHFDYIDLDGEYVINQDLGVHPFVSQGNIQLSTEAGLGRSFQKVLTL